MIEGFVTHEGALYELRRWVFAAGTQKKAAKLLGISPAYLSDVLAGRREVSAQLADKLGMQKVVMFCRKEPSSNDRQIGP